MSISRSSWDKWAPMAYLFIIGLVAGFVTGYAFGMVNRDASDAAYFLILPLAIIIIAFIFLVLIARGMSKPLK